jgi:CheY-like chemotaxis protein
LVTTCAEVVTPEYITSSSANDGRYMFDAIRRLFLGQPPYRFDFLEARRRCRVLLIDDDPAALPLSEIIKADYSCAQEKIVTGDLLRQCETGVFDIIILDYNGIAPKSITPNDGFGVFDRIRLNNPDQYIIAISGQTYDISKTAYFKEANDWLMKPTDLTTTINKIDSGIKYLFDKTEVLFRLRRQLIDEGARPKDADRLIRDIERRGYRDVDDMAETIKRVAKLTDLSAKVLGIARNLAKLSAL